MRLANSNDFYDGSAYTYYQHHEGFAKRAQFLASYPDPILVVGCAFGFLVDELLKIGKLAYGIDAARWAINQSAEGLISRVWQADILNANDLAYLLTLPTLATVVTEDLLTYLTDQEAAEAAQNCAGLALSVVHLVTEHGQANFNFHTLAEWEAITGQPVYSLEGM